MNYYKAPFWRRFEIMGDWSEAAIVEYCNQHNYKYTPFGFNRPNITFRKLPGFLQHMPDFIVEGFNKELVFVEGKGVGRDGIVKIKQQDIDILSEWQQRMPVYFSIYHSNKSKICFGIPLNEVVGLCNKSESACFPDNNKLYYKLPIKQFAWECITNVHSLTLPQQEDPNGY